MTDCNGPKNSVPTWQLTANQNVQVRTTLSPGQKSNPNPIRDPRSRSTLYIQQQKQHNHLKENRVAPKESRPAIPLAYSARCQMLVLVL